MANEEHLTILQRGVEAWNAWRQKQGDIRPDLGGASLNGANLREADFSEADLSGASLDGADLSRASLGGADLGWTNLSGASLREANLSRPVSRWVRRLFLFEAPLGGVPIGGADLRGAHLIGADLSGADLGWANLAGANLSDANLAGANLQYGVLVGTDLTGANLTVCRIYGMSAWDLKLEGVTQVDLIITKPNQPEITVDNLEVAQFIYLLLNNERIRHVIDTITSKVVLILGRFTPERKAVLDALREELRKHDYLPILFDFDVPAGRDITETVSLLARMARFIVADLTDPSSIPKELEAIVPSLAVPVQPLLEGAERPYAMFKDYWKYDWVLPVHRYEGHEQLLAGMAEKVTGPAEAKVRALEERRRAIEAELTKPS